MHFTENLSAHPEAVMDLNQMLEQTEIIAKWFTQKSVDNLVDLLDSNIDKTANELTLPNNLSGLYNVPPLLMNSPLLENQIKAAFEKTKNVRQPTTTIFWG